MILISIITPVLNGRQWIENCIQSVIDQACPGTEHIIIDGGSTDGTIKIIQDFADSFSHIRWVSARDKGQSDAMNKGIELACGSIVGFLNADDYYEPNVLNEVLEEFKAILAPGLLVGNCNVWDNQDNLLWVNKPRNLKIEDLLLGWNANPFPINPSAYFFHKSLIEKTGKFNAGEHYVLDADFLMRAVQAANVRYVDKTWGNYRLIEGTKTFEDIRRDLASVRLDRIYKTYRKGLPVLKRWKISLLYRYYNSQPWVTIDYFKKNPQELGWRVRNRIRKTLGLIA